MGTDTPDLAPIKFVLRGKERIFDVTDPKLPEWIDDNDLTADDYPYKEKLKSEQFEAEMGQLQLELVKLLSWMSTSGARVVCVFEGRDAAGKGGTISALRENMNPRQARNVALPKPTETERSQWYFQRYAVHLPCAGEFVTFDRSWYNRGGVEPVMGFCTPEQHKRFLSDAPEFEDLIVRDGIFYFKFWLDISQETQLKHFHDRYQDPLRRWKFTPMDVKGIALWDAYSKARNTMLEKTHTKFAPWTVVKANDKRRLRLGVIRSILEGIPYEGKDAKAIGIRDKKIVGVPKDMI